MTKNILLITSDQQHWSLLGKQNSEVKTPHLDRLCEQGTLFERAYCPNPTCTPTRASIITGQYPSQHGAYSLGTKLPESAQTVGDILREHNYATALIGKAHFQPLKETPEYTSLESYPTLQNLDFWKDYDQPFYGFQHLRTCRNHVAEAHVGQHYAIWMEEKGFDSWREHYNPPTGTMPKDREHSWSLPQEYHYNEFIVEETCNWVEKQVDNDKPFFAWASFPDPHPPYLVPEPWASMFNPDEVTVPEVTPGEHENNPPHFGLTQTENPDFSYWDEEEGDCLHGCGSHLHDRRALAKDIATYYGMMAYTDDAVGRILAHLDRLGIAEDTLVIFTSDHGHFYGQHGLIAKGPFHYEDLVKVPFIVSQPGTVPTDKRKSGMVSLVDLAPSILAYADISAPRSMTGKNQLPYWQGITEAPRDHVLVENHHNPTKCHLLSYISETHKITVYRDANYGEIFDLVNDPDELSNLWDDPQSQALKSNLLHQLISAELAKDPVLMPRIYGA